MMKPLSPEGTVVKEKFPIIKVMNGITCGLFLAAFILFTVKVFDASRRIDVNVIEKEISGREKVLDESFKPKFVKVEFDLEEGTMYVKLRPGEIYETRELTVIDKYVLEDAVMLDFSKDGKLIGVEVIKVDK